MLMPLLLAGLRDSSKEVTYADVCWGMRDSSKEVTSAA